MVRRTLAVLVVAAIALGAVAAAGSAATHSTRKAADAAGVRPNAIGQLDCNGFSGIQTPAHRTAACTDLRRVYDGKPGRFYDNGHYIGHDEPSLRYLSARPGSSNNVTWVETLPRDPVAVPTVATPGKDITHWFELSIAPWFSMPICDPRSYPLAPCKPNSDSNAPKHPPTYDVGGGGSAFMELQFYPPGFAPVPDAISCDNTHWCGALTIDSLECTAGFEDCNSNCEEPQQFAFLQRDGIPTGPPSPQRSNYASHTPNGQTLMMNPGDKLSIHMFDAALGGGGHALETRVTDLTTHQTGWMIASAHNGFMNTSFSDCSGHPFNFEPEYSTAKVGNIVPWAALQAGIVTQYEIGHFEACTSVTRPTPIDLGPFTDTFWNICKGPYESSTGPDKGSNPEVTSAPCYPKGDTHKGHTAPNLVTGCVAFFAGGDIDFDGSPYWPDWPNSLTPNRDPSPFLQQQPTTNGAKYPQIQFETDVAASEQLTCGPSTLNGCRVPVPGSPGHFYPYFTHMTINGQCQWAFGRMNQGITYGRDLQYGHPSAYFFGDLASQIKPNPCV
jgi:hypothetical protein